MNFAKEFLEFEQSHSCYTLRVNNIPIWERIRFNVYREIQQKNGLGEAHTQADKDLSDYFKGGTLFAKNFVRRNPFLADSTDHMFVGHPRRKKEADGYWWDIYCDPIHEYYDYDYVHFETPHQLQHHQPAKTEQLRYLDLISYAGNIQQLIGRNPPAVPDTVRKELKRIQVEIRKRFNAKVGLIEMTQSKLYQRQTQLGLYKRLLDQVDPELVVLVVGYGKETLIEACQGHNIPVVELQHGVIYEDHFGYSYPGPRTKEAFPDYLLVWGDFWKDAAEYPIPDENVIPVGYPYLEQSVEKYNGIESKEQILFISQGTIGEQLSKFALEVEEHPDIEHDIVYKLHPGEYDRWQDEYPWLVDARIDVIDGSEPPLYELFGESSVQVGVYSTAIYEGLAFNLETYVYDCSGSDILEPLIEDGSAKLVSSADKLALLLGMENNSFNSDYYFVPNATENACEVLQQLADVATSYQNPVSVSHESSSVE